MATEMNNGNPVDQKTSEKKELVTGETGADVRSEFPDQSAMKASLREAVGDAGSHLLDTAKQQAQRKKYQGENGSGQLMGWIDARPIASVLIAATLGFIITRLTR